MSVIIDRYKEDFFNTVEKSYFKCPICGGDLYTVDNVMACVLDGNTVYHCENHEDHSFWHHPFEKNNILHLNKYASETNFTSEQDFVLENGSWIRC